MSKGKKDANEKPKRLRAVAKKNPTTAAFDVSDELWAVLGSLIPEHVNTHRFGGGRPRVPDRKCANGIFYVLRTGCQWKALDKTSVCSGSTAHLRFQEWVAAGVFLQFWEAGLAQYDEVKGIDWEWLSMDGAMTKAPLGGEKNRPQPYRSRQGRRKAQRADGGERGAHWTGGRGGQSQ